MKGNINRYASVLSLFTEAQRCIPQSSEWRIAVWTIAASGNEPQPLRQRVNFGSSFVRLAELAFDISIQALLSLYLHRTAWAGYP